MYGGGIPIYWRVRKTLEIFFNKELCLRHLSLAAEISCSENHVLLSMRCIALLILSAQARAQSMCGNINNGESFAMSNTA